MKQKIIDEILQGMQRHLDNAEMLLLRKLLESSFARVDIVENVTLCLTDELEKNKHELDLFIAAKKTDFVDSDAERFDTIALGVNFVNIYVRCKKSCTGKMEDSYSPSD